MRRLLISFVLLVSTVFITSNVEAQTVYFIGKKSKACTIGGKKLGHGSYATHHEKFILHCTDYKNRGGYFYVHASKGRIVKLGTDFLNCKNIARNKYRGLKWGKGKLRHLGRPDKNKDVFFKFTDAHDAWRPLKNTGCSGNQPSPTVYHIVSEGCRIDNIPVKPGDYATHYESWLLHCATFKNWPYGYTLRIDTRRHRTFGPLWLKECKAIRKNTGRGVEGPYGKSRRLNGVPNSDVSFNFGSATDNWHHMTGEGCTGSKPSVMIYHIVSRHGCTINNRQVKAGSYATYTGRFIFYCYNSAGRFSFRLVQARKGWVLPITDLKTCDSVAIEINNKMGGRRYIGYASDKGDTFFKFSDYSESYKDLTNAGCTGSKRILTTNSEEGASDLVKVEGSS